MSEKQSERQRAGGRLCAGEMSVLSVRAAASADARAGRPCDVVGPMVYPEASRWGAPDSLAPLYDDVYRGQHCKYRELHPLF